MNGRIIYYFGDEYDKAEDHNLPLPIKVIKEPRQTVPSPTSDGGVALKTPGFAGELAIIGILFMAWYIKWCSLRKERWNWKDARHQRLRKRDAFEQDAERDRGIKGEKI